MNEPAVIERDFQGFNIRTLEKNDGEIWCVAQDAMSVLGLSNITEMLKSVDPDEKSSELLKSARGIREMITISESALYGIILKRTNAKIKDREVRERVAQFQRWVRKDLLVTLRKTGSYSMPNAELEPAQEITVSSTPALDMLQLQVDAHRETHVRIDALQAEHRERTYTLQADFTKLEARVAALMDKANDTQLYIEKPVTELTPVKKDDQPDDATLRSQCKTIVKDIVGRCACTHKETWSSAYDILKHRHGVDARRYKKAHKFDTTLDAVMDMGYMPELHQILEERRRLHA